MSHDNLPWQADKDGVRLFVHLTPKAARDTVVEVVIGADGQSVLKVRVRAIPDKGKANQAAIKLLAKWLSVPKSSVELVSGGRSRYKTIKIYGDAAEISKTLETCIK